MNPGRYLSAAIMAAGCIGCSDDPPTSPAVSPPIEHLFVFARTTTEDAEVEVTRRDGQTTVILYHPPHPDRPRILLDSIGPASEDPEKVRLMLESFDLWALNAPNAPGAACSTKNGQRTCHPTFNDYSVVMQVESGNQVRVQRYTHLESTGVPTVRALGDFILDWARSLEPTSRRAVSSFQLPARARAGS